MENVFQIKAQLLREGAKLPSKTYESDTCWDVSYCPAYAPTDECHIPPCGRRVLGTGLRIQPPQGYGLQVRPRSGLACTFCTTIVNTPGTIDEHYRGELKIILINHGHAPLVIMPGDRIAQVCLEQVIYGQWVEADVSEDTDRGTGGCGSTGR
jgi:dUTP pyrophosphatase